MPRSASAWLAAGCLLLASSCVVLGYDFDKNAPPAGAGGSGATGGGGSGAGEPCVEAADCPGPDSDCGVVSCVEQTCTILATAKGTPVGTQAPGDCKRQVCDGEGQTVQIVDDDDVPIDGNECSTDQCVDGEPGHSPLDGTRCGTGLTCEDGACAGCTSDEQCGPGTGCDTPTCVLSVCTSVPAFEGSKCGPCQSCQQGACVAAPAGYDDAVTCPTSSRDPCGQDGKCDGVGGCKHADPGTVCLMASCANGLEQLTDICDGSGVCADQGSLTCDEYVCGDDGHCLVQCDDHVDCVASWMCDSAICVDCTSCNEWFGLPTAMGGVFCPPGAQDTQALVDALYDCACVSGCANACNEWCIDGTVTSACITCLNGTCAQQKADCLADMGAH